MLPEWGPEGPMLKEGQSMPPSRTYPPRAWDAAKQELTAYAGELATRRAHQILRESMTDQDRKKLFEESLDQIGEKRS